MAKTPKVPTYIVLSYEVCFKCCREHTQQEFGLGFEGPDGVLVWELKGEGPAWLGYGAFRCPHLDWTNVVRGIRGDGHRAEREEIPRGCRYYLEQLLMAKRYNNMAEVRRAYRKMVSKRVRRFADERR